MDLQHNDLTTIPKCVLELPSLEELNLSNNKLTEIPDVAEWSPCLTVLDLSNNQLNNLPLNVVASAIRSLNLTKNRFHNVPLCICSFTTLHSLTLSENPDILTLPAEMGRLSYLSHLNLSGLKDLNVPPKNLQKECRDCIRYLNSMLRSARGFYRMKLMLVGYANRGKTTLVVRLQGKEYGDESTVGVDMSEWWYRPAVGRRSFHFSIWDFGGQEEYYATHQIFLSDNSLYLLLFNLKLGDKGVEELRPWLNNIALRAPHSCVIIIGTHLDEVSDEERGEIDALLHRVGNLAASYNNKLQIMEVLPVGLKNRIENISLLKEAIYNHAANYRNQAGQLIMGRKIPASYHALDKQLETVQQEVRQGIREPIMHAEEFRTMVHQMNLADIQDEEELKNATLFLTDAGSLLYYDDHGSDLQELYFVDPRWLCDMISKVVTIKEKNPFVKSGILYSKDIPMLFKDKQFPWQYFEQYLTLLDRFEIALALDNTRVLIPSMLPDERPKEFFEDEKPESDEPVYSRFVRFSSANTPPGFWSRLLSRVMHSIPKVRYALLKSSSCSEPAPSPTIPNSHNNAEAEMSFSMHPMTPTEAFTEVSASAEVSLNISTASSSDANTPASTPGSAAPFIPPPTISGLLPFISAQKPDINSLQLLSRSAPNDVGNHYNTKDVHLQYWCTGLYYRDPEVMFRIESLLGSKQFKRTSKDGLVINASMNNVGKEVTGQLIDLVLSLIGEWYSGLKKGIEQAVPCLECIKKRRVKPFEFQVKQCIPLISKNETVTECRYFRDDPTKNHTVFLTDIVPDLLLQDIDSEFILEAEEIIFKEEDASLLGEGGYGRVYYGKYKTKSVAIKKYVKRSEGALARLRLEAKLLLQSHYPCLVCLIGICVHPLMALVLEKAPLRSLDFPLLKRKIPIHRLTIFRIATEVAAALRFLHSQGIIFRDLKASNILLWTLDPDSLCHCKVADFSIAARLAPTGNRGLLGTKGFIAPEVLFIGKRKQRSVYDHKADIFSFGMFLYQIIARRRPYHNIPPHRIDVAVESGERPKLQDVDIAHSGYYYLTQIMKACWVDNPKDRLDTDTIIKKVCQSSTQIVMCVAPISISKQSLRRAVAITPSAFANTGHFNRLESELWVCCDGNEGAEINMFNTHSMVKINGVFIKDNQVQCMVFCGDHVWVASRAGIEYGVIDIFSVGSRELVHNVRMHENSVSCITATDKAVYLGTLEGCCFSFYNDISALRANVKPRYKTYISEHAVDGIVCTQQCVWVAHTRYIYFLNFDNLALEGSIHREKEREAYIGQLSFDPDCNIVWSAHLGGVILSAWDAYNKCHMYDIDMGKHLNKISPDTKDPDLLITAMTPALDTVWVGMASGHIMVFHEDELLSWFHPYKGYIRFLTCISSTGPCEMEKAMIVSGGKGFTPLVEGLEGKVNSKEEEICHSDTMIIWEAYEAKTIKQVKLVEMSSPDHLKDHNSLCHVIRQGNFRDGTLITSNSTVTNDPLTETIHDIEAQSNELNQNPSPIASLRANRAMHEDSSQKGNAIISTATSGYGTLTATLTQEFQDEEDENEMDLSPTIPEEVQIHASATTSVEELITIMLPDSKQVILVRCPKPVELKALLGEVQVTVGQNECRLEFYRDGKVFNICTQEGLDEYLEMQNKPQLFVAQRVRKC